LLIIFFIEIPNNNNAIIKSAKTIVNAAPGQNINLKISPIIRKIIEVLIKPKITLDEKVEELRSLLIT